MTYCVECFHVKFGVPEACAILFGVSGYLNSIPRPGKAIQPSAQS